MIERLSKRALQKILGGQVKEEATCIVKFYSNNCHYCHALKDEYETIADNNEGIEFYAFNIDDYPQVQKVMNFLGVPTISFIIGEGGSGGAVALASSYKIIMFENSIYSIISPEGCASILWRDPSKSLEAAEAMKLTAHDLLKQGIIDGVISEPAGGAHRHKDQILEDVKVSLKKNLNEFNSFTRNEVFDHKKTKFLNIGRERGFASPTQNKNRLGAKENYFNRLKKFLLKFFSLIKL